MARRAVLAVCLLAFSTQLAIAQPGNSFGPAVNATQPVAPTAAATTPAAAQSTVVAKEKINNIQNDFVDRDWNATMSNYDEHSEVLVYYFYSSVQGTGFFQRLLNKEHIGYLFTILYNELRTTNCGRAYLNEASAPGAALPTAMFAWRCAPLGVKDAFETMSFNPTTGFVQRHAVYMWADYSAEAFFGGPALQNILLAPGLSLDMLTNYKAAAFGGESVDMSKVLAAYTNQSRITVYDNQAEGKLQEYAGEVGASAYFTQLGPRNRESPEVDMRLEHVEDSPQHVVQMAWANTVCGHSGVVETLFLDAAGKVVQQYVFTQKTTNLKHGCDPSAAITTLPAVAPASTAEANHACTQTIAFSVLKQANVAVGFADMARTQLPVQIATVESSTGQLAYVSITCTGTSLSVTYEGAWSDGTPSSTPITVGKNYQWDAGGSHAGSKWTTKVALADIMYDTAFDGDDVFHGEFVVAVDDRYLEDKFAWARNGTSTLADVIAKTRTMKAATGGCPLLSPTHKRSRDLGGDHLDIPRRRMDYLQQTIVEELNGVADTASKDFNQLQWLATLQAKDDDISLSRDHTNDMPLLIDQMTCMAPAFVLATGEPMAVMRADNYKHAKVRKTTMVGYTGEGKNRLHNGVHTGGANPSIVTYPMYAAKDEQIRWKALLVDKVLPPNNGLGKFPPELSTKWQRLANQKQLNISHIKELVIGLGHHWVSGAPLLAHTEQLLGMRADCAGNTLINRHYVGSYVPDKWVSGRTTCLDPKQPWMVPSADMGRHYYRSPIQDVLRAANAADYGVYADLYSASGMAEVMNSNFFFLSAQLQMMARFTLEHDEVIAAYKVDPEKTILELYRLSAPTTMAFTMPEPTTASPDDLVHVNTTYTQRPGEQVKTGRIYAGAEQLERFALYAANRDPAAFKKPNTFDPNRTEWGESLAFGAPLKEVFYTETDGTDAFDATKATRASTTAEFYCAGFYLAKELAKKIIGLMIDSQEGAYAAMKEEATDNENEVLRHFGPGRIYAHKIDLGGALGEVEYSICENAIARVDARYSKGVGCQYWKGICRKTCAELAVPGAIDSVRYTQLVRMLMLRTMWFSDQFSKTGVATYKYFLATQRYWNADSIVEVTPTGKSNYYKGPESIMEYYSLQNKAFNPESYREAVSEWSLITHEHPRWGKGLAGGKRLQSWNFDPAWTLGVEADNWQPPYDFSQFVWNDTTTIVPIQRAFHDFRKPTLEWRYKGLPSGMWDAYGDAEDLCHLIQERCYGDFQQFKDFKECYTYMSKVPHKKTGWCPILAGNTLNCRWTHAILTHEKMRPDIHCYHMGPNKPDPSGNYKCHDDECGKDGAGRLECDETSCDGAFMPAGQWVDELHCWFWGIGFLLCVSYAYLINGRVKTMTSLLEDERRCEKMDPEALDAAEDVLDSMQRMFPLAIGATFVFGWFTLVFIVCAVFKPAYLWRPWPEAALYPRFSEFHSKSGEIKTRFWYSDYDGANTEPVFSSLNHYMLDHLIMYLMIGGTIIFVMALEWIGHRMHSTTTLAWVAVDLVQLGHAAFSVFVTTAIYFPLSAFSYFIFSIGITKLLYPEITYTMWMAYIQPAKALELVVEQPAHLKKQKKNPLYERSRKSLWDISLATAATEKGETAGFSVKARALFRAVSMAQAPPVGTSHQRPSFVTASQQKSQRRSTWKSNYFNSPVPEHGRKTMAQIQSTNEHLNKYGRHKERVIDLNVPWSVEFMIHTSAGCGLMLHHFSLIVIFIVSSLHLHFTDLPAFKFGISVPLFLVLIQHIVAQTVPTAVARGIVLAVVEVFFQWFTISAMSENGSTIGTVCSLGLCASHFFMGPEIPYGIYKAIFVAPNDSNDNDDGSPTFAQEPYGAMSRVQSSVRRNDNHVLRADTEADALFMPVGHKDSGGDFGFNSNAFMRARGSSKETPRSVRFKDRAQGPGIVPRPSSAVHDDEPHDDEQVHSFVVTGSNQPTFSLMNSTTSVSSTDPSQPTTTSTSSTDPSQSTEPRAPNLGMTTIWEPGVPGTVQGWKPKPKPGTDYTLASSTVPLPSDTVAPRAMSGVGGNTPGLASSMSMGGEPAFVFDAANLRRGSAVENLRRGSAVAYHTSDV